MSARKQIPWTRCWRPTAPERLRPALHALVGSHLALSPDNRRFVAAMEELAAERMAQDEPVPLADRDGRLAAIFAGEEASTPPSRPIGDPIFPAALRNYIGQGFEELKWRRLLPGVREHKIERAGRGKANLFLDQSGPDPAGSYP